VSDGNLGKTIEKIIGKIKDEMKEKEIENPEDATPATSVVPDKIYLKAISLHSSEELDDIKRDVKGGNILIIRVSPLAEKSVDDVKRAVGELCEFAEQINGDIARLGEERIVVTPSFVRVWREKSAASEGGASTKTT
jgi:hypothetical protein